MPTASIQIVQGASDYDIDKSAIDLDRTASVDITDVSGGPAVNTSTQVRTWELVSHSFDTASPPTLSSASAETTVLDTGGLDGMAIVKLSRLDGGVATYKYVLLGFPSAAGYLIPCPGANGRLFDLTIDGTEAQALGVAGGKGAAGMDTLVNRQLRDLIAGLGGGSGVLSSLTWNPSVVTDAATGTYQTFAAVTAAISGLKGPILLGLRGTCNANVAGSYNWANVTLFAASGDCALVGSEGVALRDATIRKGNGVITMTSAATTTRLFTYSDGVYPVIEGISGSGSATRGLFYSEDGFSAQFTFDGGCNLSYNVVEGDGAVGMTIETRLAEWESGAGGNILGDATTFGITRNFLSRGTPELDNWTGPAPTYTNYEVATNINGITIAGTPSAGQVPTALTGTTAEWATPSAGGGVLSALTWDSSQAADLAVGRVQTFAELTAEIGTIESPISVQVVADANVNVAGTYAYSNVAFWSNDPAVTLTFNTNGVHVQDAKFSGLGLVNTSTNVALDYTGNKSATFDNCALSGSTKGVFTFTATGANTAYIIGGSTLDEYAFEQTVAADVTFVTENATYLGTGQFAGSLGTLTYKRTGATSGDPDLTHWSGSGPTYNTTQANAIRIQGYPVDGTTPTDGQVIQYDGDNAWYAPATLPSAVFPAVLIKHARWLRRKNTGAIQADYSLGLKFEVHEACTVKGGMIWWKCSSGTASVDVVLYNAAGTVLATATQAVTTTATEYSVLFGTPYAVSGAVLGTKLMIAVYQTTGTAESYYDNSTTNMTAPMPIGPGILSWGNYYIAGPGGAPPRTTPAMPNTGPAATELYGINPIITLADYPT